MYAGPNHKMHWNDKFKLVTAKLRVANLFKNAWLAWNDGIILLQLKNECSKVANNHRTTDQTKQREMNSKKWQ